MKSQEEQLRAIAARAAEEPAGTPTEADDATNNVPVAPAVPEIDPDNPTVEADRIEAMIVEFREKWCKQFMDSTMQITIKPLGLQALVELFQSNSFITHRAQDGGNCVFVLDAGLDVDCPYFERQSQFSKWPQLDPISVKILVKTIEKHCTLPTDMM